jgi:hypothetical protein
MLKLFLIIALSIVGATLMVATAQNPVPKPGLTLGGNVIYSKPKGDFANTYNFGGGGELFGGIGVGKTYLIVTAGLSKFDDNSSSHLGTLTYTPVKVGLKQFFFRKLLFVNADLGKATVRNKYVNQSRFTRGIGVGAKLLGIEAALYYDGWKNINAPGFSNSVNVKVGVSLTL